MGNRTGMKTWIAALAVTAFMAAPVYAAKPDDAGKGNKGNKGNPHAEQSHKSGKPGNSGQAGKPGNAGGASHSGGGSGSSSVNLFFGDDRRSIIRDYYSHEFSGGHCPPGLAKKNNGCLPPGQAKKWQVGHRLPDDLIYYDLPGDLMRRLGHNDPAYKLIRVGADILKIGVGTGLVVEAVEDLGGLF